MTGASRPCVAKEKRAASSCLMEEPIGYANGLEKGAKVMTAGLPGLGSDGRPEADAQS
jgi:hypothetical protein